MNWKFWRKPAPAPVSPHCPDCGGTDLEVSSECPRYSSNGTWWCCLPPCGNATEWECPCGWSYIDGLNPGFEAQCMPRNATHRPSWLDHMRGRGV